MTSETHEEPTDQLRAAIASDDIQATDAFLEELPAGESARAVSRLNVEDQSRLLEILPVDHAADLLEELPESQAAQMIEHLGVESAAEILNKVASDEKADILSRLEESTAESILEHMTSDMAADARRLMKYPADTAGGLMISEYLAYPQQLRVEDVLADLRENAYKYRSYDVQYAYVVGAKRRLTGVLRLRDLLLADPATQLGDLMISDPVAVSDYDTLDELQQFFDRHHFLGSPVVSAQQRLVGVVKQHDVREAAEERAGQTLLKLTGIMGGEEFRTMPVRQRSFRRLSWLSINIVLNMVAASVIALYQDTLEAVIALAVFLPIISDMSGCSGNQAVAVSMRELSLGLVRPGEFFRVLWKEAAVGIINGLVLGFLLGTIAVIWKGNAALGLVVAAALMLNTLVAVCLGGCIPLVLRGLKQDPALASGPILTTITDMCGFFLVLSLANSMLPWIL